jgi:RNA-directed DNA polymerase
MGSRDSTKRSGRPGVDNVSAVQFAAKLDSNLAETALRIRREKYGFSKLRAVFVPKPNSDKERLICIPVVRDRLVQRVIVEYLTSRRSFPIYNSSSFGFIKGRGTREAIGAVVKHRAKYDWCLKTDIEAFFDRIPRDHLKKQVRACLGAHSLTPLIFKVIDCEVKVTQLNRAKVAKQKILPGQGVRQGMPLSPMLANLALSDFDRQISDAKIEMVRYADDLALFFHSKEAAETGQHLVKSILKKIQLAIPEIYDGSKTKIVSRSDPMDFLGREVVFLGSENRFVARVASKQVDKIKSRLSDDYSLKNRFAAGNNFQDTIVELTKSIAAYLGIYKDAFNYESFENELRGHGRSVIMKIFQELFGQDALKSLSWDSRKFLGIEILDETDANPELDV